MNYETTINGLEVHASYSETAIEEIFHPLLKTLQELQKKKGGRILILLAAPPAAGKSTLLSFLQHYAHTHFPDMKLNTIGMDGFHHYQEYLLSHSLFREGQEITMVDVKGCPETFHLSRLRAFIERLAKGENLGWPTYDRLLHDPVEDAVFVDGDIVLLEGNYLLLDEPGWRELKNYADYTISVSADPEELKKRLVDRRMATGTSYEKSVAFVERSDLYNAKLVLSHMLEADLKLTLLPSGEYIRSTT